MLRKTKTKSLSSYVITNQLSNSLYLINYIKKRKKLYYKASLLYQDGKKILMKLLILLSILYIIILIEGVSQPINEKVI